MSKHSKKIGVPELNEDQLVEFINHIEKSVRKFIFSRVNNKFIDDFDINIILDKKDQELFLTINIEITFFNITVPNIDQILDNALNVGIKALENEIKSSKK